MKSILKMFLQYWGALIFVLKESWRGNAILARKIVGTSRIHLGRGMYVSDGARIISEHGGSITIGNGSKIGTMSIIEDRGGSITIGKNTSLNSLSVLYGHGGLSIGDDCIFATGLIVVPANHNFSDTHQLIKDQGETMKGIRIGNNVWCGARVTILDGVTIGDGVVIGAGAVVTKNIPANTIAVGIPARVIRQK